MRQRIIDTIDSLAHEMQETSRWMFEHPELSGEEHVSARLLAKRAQSNGMHVEYGVAGLATAFRAVGKPAYTGKRVAFLAEYDALPEIGHGCGHNMIGTCGTYAAIALAKALSDVPDVDVALFGTPAEETDGGKIIMLKAGAFRDVAAALMIHPGLWTEIAYSSLACISCVVEFFGREAHAAAAPWKGINALDAMIQLFVAIDGARKQLPLTVRMPGVILKGGDRANVVPAYTKAQFSVRGKDLAEAEHAVDRLVECARAAATATRTRMECHREDNPYLDMRPDPHLASIFREVWHELGGEQPMTEKMPHGSLDIGNLSHVFPCLHPSIRIAEDEATAGHTREFANATQTPFAMQQMMRATKALALTGLEIGRSQ